MKHIGYTREDERLFAPIRKRLEEEYGYANTHAVRYEDGDEPWCRILVLRDQVQRELDRSMAYDHEAMTEAIRRYEAGEKGRQVMDGAEEYEYLIASAELMEGLK